MPKDSTQEIAHQAKYYEQNGYVRCSSGEASRLRELKVDVKDSETPYDIFWAPEWAVRSYRVCGLYHPEQVEECIRKVVNNRKLREGLRASIDLADDRNQAVKRFFFRDE